MDLTSGNITFILIVLCLLKGVPADQWPKNASLIGAVTDKVNCSEGESVVFTRGTPRPGSNLTAYCGRYMTGVLNYYCGFKQQCAVYREDFFCIDGYSELDLEYYCIRNDKLHRSCGGKINLKPELGSYSVVTSNNYPRSAMTGSCAYTLIIPDGYQVHLEVSDCYFPATADGKQVCVSATKTPTVSKLRGTTVLNVKHKSENYAGFLAVYKVENADELTTAVQSEMLTTEEGSKPKDTTVDMTTEAPLMFTEAITNLHTSTSATTMEQTWQDHTTSGVTEVDVNTTTVLPLHEENRTKDLITGPLIGIIVLTNLGLAIIALTAVSCWFYRRSRPAQPPQPVIQPVVAEYEKVDHTSAAPVPVYSQLQTSSGGEQA